MKKLMMMSLMKFVMISCWMDMKPVSVWLQKKYYCPKVNTFLLCISLSFELVLLNIGFTRHEEFMFTRSEAGVVQIYISIRINGRYKFCWFCPFQMKCVLIHSVAYLFIPKFKFRYMKHYILNTMLWCDTASIYLFLDSTTAVEVSWFCLYLILSYIWRINSKIELYLF